MRRDEVLAKLRAYETELRAAGVEALYLFGSVARDEAIEGSDVDLLFEARPGTMRSLFDVFGARHICEDALGGQVDLVDRAGLRDEVRPAALRDARRIF